MTGTLQRKFVITAMTAITVLILLLLGTINIANIVMVGKQIDDRLFMISENEGRPENAPAAPDRGAPAVPFGPKNDYDAFLSSNFFVVRFDTGGEVVFTDTSRISSLTEEAAIELAQEIYESDTESGRTGRFQYRVKNSRTGTGRVIVFLDTTEDIYSCIRVLFLSAGIGILCWLIMLVFVVLLSKKAIRPIALNIEKQKQFVTNAGHELKTPLAIIQANTEAMELYQGENKWSRNIKEQTIRLNELMKNLLTLARMEENAASLKISEVPLSQLVTETIQSFSQNLELRNISLQTEIQPMVAFRANREHMVQLISVLMDNAVKYTNDGGRIQITLEKNNKRIKMQFRNSCDQLPPVSPDKLFDRFYRADEARTQKSGGYGIGLSVAQSITETYRGKISAVYEDGNTIVFTVRF